MSNADHSIIRKAARCLQAANHTDTRYLNADQRDAVESAAYPAYVELARALADKNLLRPEIDDEMVMRGMQALHTYGEYVTPLEILLPTHGDSWRAQVTAVLEAALGSD